MGNQLISNSKLRKPIFFAFMALLLNLALVWIGQRAQDGIEFHPGYLLTVVAIVSVAIVFSYNSRLRAKVGAIGALLVGIGLSLYADTFLSENVSLSRVFTPQMMEYMNGAALFFCAMTLGWIAIIFTINGLGSAYRRNMQAMSASPGKTVGQKFGIAARAVLVATTFGAVVLVVALLFNALFPDGGTVIHDVIGHANTGIEQGVAEAKETTGLVAVLVGIVVWLFEGMNILWIFLGFVSLFIFGGLIFKKPRQDGFFHDILVTNKQSGLILLIIVAISAYLIGKVFNFL